MDIRPLGDRAATIMFGESISPEIHRDVRRFCAALAKNPVEGVEEWAPAFASVTLWYDPDRLSFAALCDRIRARATKNEELSDEGRAIAAPFCADPDFAPDLAEVAMLNGFSPQDYLDRLCAQTFDVYMLGFLPGFAYLGILPQELSAPRLKTPRPKIPAGSVAIADGMCAAYPSESPGGWRLIGRTPTRLFDISRQNPSFFAAGDRVRWRQISRAEYLALEAAP